MDREDEDYQLYTAKVIEDIDNGEKYWKYLTIGVYEDEKLLGTYQRNYSSFMDTFYPFTLEGRQFALYSPEYTATRVMEIFPGEGFKDHCGEKPDSCGFCPTGYYVPKDIDWFNLDEINRYDGNLVWSEDHPDNMLFPAVKERVDKNGIVTRPAKPVEIKYYVEHPQTFGFVSGCVWGDDSSWKIEFLDLSEVPRGVLKREARFGYIELPNNLKLEDAVNTESCYYINGLGYRRISIAIRQDFNIVTGERKDR